ncbi:MAG: DUF4282 domain-containing protein [Armatimonadota bacterium]|nr:DUF4282 domain-containing protein [Armatimonadota bacterium]MDW8155375.1 DUF4282 domain-containing protein [Armatimonadota bacterium]
MFVVDFFLRRMVTDEAGVVLYPPGSFLIVVVSVPIVVQGVRDGVAGQAALAALLLMVFGNLIWRVVCEAAVALVAIHERLREVRDALRSQVCGGTRSLS